MKGEKEKKRKKFEGEKRTIFFSASQIAGRKTNNNNWQATYEANLSWKRQRWSVIVRVLDVEITRDQVKGLIIHANWDGKNMILSNLIHHIEESREMSSTNDIYSFPFLGVRQEQDIYVRLIDSVTKQVSWTGKPSMLLISDFRK